MSKRNIAIILALVAGLAVYLDEQGLLPGQGVSNEAARIDSPIAGDNGTRTIAEAYRAQRSDLQVQGEGTVIKVLKDDLDGSRHQRFILRLDNEQTLLVAHNIDLAPRIDNLKKGDRVEFFGEYEWSNKGGVMHWTHHDPGGRHVDGWLKHEGRTYH